MFEVAVPLEGQVRFEPFLAKAFYQYLVAAGETPHFVVRVGPRAIVPPEHVSDGMIVLNLHPDAVRELVMNDEIIRFKARFKGVDVFIEFPMLYVVSVFARDNPSVRLVIRSVTKEEIERDFSPKPALRPALKIVK